LTFFLLQHIISHNPLRRLADGNRERRVDFGEKEEPHKLFLLSSSSFNALPRTIFPTLKEQ